MGAGASANGESNAMYSQVMAKWDELSKQPEYAVDVLKPGPDSTFL
jgi:hypothetical protein